MAALALPAIDTLDTKGILVGLCNALLDVTAKVTPDYLAKYGLKANHAILSDEKTCHIAEEVSKLYPVTFTAGGAGQNAMRSAQWLLPEGSTVYFGCVGEDAFGSQMEKVAREDGVQVCYRKDISKVTGSCATLLTEAGRSRSLIAHLAAATSFHVSHLKSPESIKIIENARVFYVTGFTMNVSLESALYLAEHALIHGKVFAMNLSASFVLEEFGDLLMQAYAYTDIVFGNETEAAAFAKLNRLPCDSLEETARAMANLSKKQKEKATPNASSGHHRRLVVITQGPGPTIVSNGETTLSFSIQARVSPSEIVDTNGAGDAFVGGFLAQLVQGRSLSEAVQKGHELAGMIIKTLGVVFPKKN